MNRPANSRCGLCGTKSCTRCGRCLNAACAAYTWCEDDEPLPGLDGAR